MWTLQIASKAFETFTLGASDAVGPRESTFRSSLHAISAIHSTGGTGGGVHFILVITAQRYAPQSLLQRANDWANFREFN
jgi:hypothetical protein